MRLSKPITKIWMKIDPHYWPQRFSSMTVVSGNVRFMGIFVGVPWRRAVKRQRDNRKRRFSGIRAFRTLYVFGTLGNESNIVWFSPLSPFHWPQNTWPWIILNGQFTLNFHYYEQRFQKLFLHIVTVEPIYISDQRRCTEADHDTQ